MAFLIQCDNKGCGQLTDALLNTETNDVECSDCGKTIKNVTDFTKKSMKSMGQVKRADTKKAFTVKCQSCKKLSPPKMENKKLVCVHCDKEITGLSKTFEDMVKGQLK